MPTKEVKPPEFYDKHYYDNMRGDGEGAIVADHVRAEKVMSFGPPEKVGRILDVGCGQGQVVSLLRDKGYDAYGIDYSPDAIRTSLAPGFCEQGDATDLRFDDGAFDTICTFHTLEHLPPEALGDALAHIGRCTKERILVVVPGLTPFATRPPQPDHQQEPSFDGWYSQLRHGLPDFRHTKSQVFEPTYWVDAYELWFEFVRRG